jgi:hypothetical protein
MKMVMEYEYLKSAFANFGKPSIPIIPYSPAKLESPKNLVDIRSSWKGIESILSDIIQRFELDTKRCLEFGVEFGYSTAALSSLFDEVSRHLHRRHAYGSAERYLPGNREPAKGI